MQTVPVPFLVPPAHAPRTARRGVSLALLLLASVGLADAGLAAPPVAQSPRPPRADVPIPPSRPMDLGVDEETEEEGPAAQAHGAPAGPSSTPSPPTTSAPSTSNPVLVQETAPPGELPALCAALVAEKQIVAERAPPVPVQAGCSLPAPVRISAVRLADGNLAAFSPPAVMRCETVAEVARWMRDDIAPAIAALGTRLETVKVADSYQCRPRNRRKGAQISEHGQGNAFDTYGFVLADSRVLSVKGGQMPVAFQNAMKASACTRFSTVLGPGSDGYHEDHIHVDMAVRRLDIRLCKWNIKSPAPALIARAEPKPGAAQAPQAAGKDEEDAPEAEGADAVPLPPRRPPGLGRAATQ